MTVDMILKNFRGNAFISLNNEIICNTSSGYSDLSNEVLNECKTKFATASAGKVFVAVGILQLIEKGLLNHTSGVPDYFDETVMDEYEELWVDFPNYKIRSNSDLLPLFIGKPMMYPHGSKFQYNNSGFVLLALVMEQITQKPFDVYLSEKIFLPCGMISTGYYELDRLPAKCASNYIFDESRNEYRTNIFSVDAKGTGAGGAFTTIDDIKLFWENLLNSKLISDNMLKEMLSNQSGDKECYGYGIWLRKDGSDYIPYFQGHDPGVSFISCYDIKKKLMVILISNYGDNVWAILRNILGAY